MNEEKRIYKSESKLSMNNNNTKKKKKKKNLEKTSSNNSLNPHIGISSSGAKGGVSAMLDARVTRKKAEADVKLLENRIKHLLLEEKKAEKKINETQKRADDIIKIKNRNKKLNKKRKTIHEHQRERVLSTSLQNKQQKNRLNSSLNESKKLTTTKKYKKAKKLRDEKKQRQRKALEMKQKVIEENRLKRERIRKHKEEIKAKKLAEEKERERKAKEMYAKRLKEETRQIMEAEKKIRDLEAKEAELIERLKRKQNEQKQAYDILQDSLQV